MRNNNNVSGVPGCCCWWCPPRPPSRSVRLLLVVVVVITTSGTTSAISAPPSAEHDPSFFTVSLGGGSSGDARAAAAAALHSSMGEVELVGVPIDMAGRTLVQVGASDLTAGVSNDKVQRWLSLPSVRAVLVEPNPIVFPRLVRSLASTYDGECVRGRPAGTSVGRSVGRSVDPSVRRSVGRCDLCFLVPIVFSFELACTRARTRVCM